MNYNNYDTSYNTSYGAGGGGGGGGWIQGEGGSQNSPSGGRKEYNDSLRPVTIKQIRDAQSDANDEFKIDGAKTSQVTIVGQIRNVATQTTNITYKLDDGTGSIEVKQWNDADAMETSPLKERLVEGAYCRAWGKLKDLGNRRHVNAQIVRPVDDMNEVSYHMLEATAVHLYITRGPIGGAGEGAGAGGGAAVNGAGQQGAAGAYGGVDLSGYNAVAKKVYQYLREAPQSNEGLHQQEIAAKLGIESAEVAKAGDAMLEGGLIYTTVDDQTWAILEAD